MGSKTEFNLLTQFYRDRIKPSWKNLAKHAQGMYDTPDEAFNVLTENAAKNLKVADLERFHLVSFIVDEMNKNINKGKGPRTVISENLETCCKFIGRPFRLVGPSKTQMNNNRKLRSIRPTWKKQYKWTFDQTVEAIVEKRRRVLLLDPRGKREFYQWRKDGYNVKEFADYLKKQISKQKK